MCSKKWVLSDIFSSTYPFHLKKDKPENTMRNYWHLKLSFSVTFIPELCCLDYNLKENSKTN